MNNFINPMDQLTEVFGEIGKLTCIWEFQLRLFCQNIGLCAYQVQIKNGKEVIYAVGLERLLKELYANYPNLGFDFSFAHKLRNAVAHANFLEFADVLHEETDINMLAKVIGLSVKTSEVMDLSEPIPEGQLSDVSVFGLFLRSMSSEMVLEAKSTINMAIEVVKKLQELSAFSGKGKYFDKLFKLGVKFTEEDYLNFDEEWKNSYIINTPGKIFLDSFYPFSNLEI